MARLLLLFVAGIIFAAHASLIPEDSLSELGDIHGEETADVPENEMPAEEDFDDGEDSDEMPEEGGEVDEGQPQEDTSDVAKTPSEDAKGGKRYKPIKRYCYYRFICRYCVYRWLKCKGYGYRRCRYQVCYGCKRSCVYPYYRGYGKRY